MATLFSIAGYSWFFALMPLVIYLALLQALDRYSVDPLTTVGLSVIWGAGGAILLGLTLSKLVGNAASTIISWDLVVPVQMVVVGPVVEEIAKASGFFFLAKGHRLNSATSGLVHGAAIGLGFAMTENFAYFLRIYMLYGKADWFAMVLMRTFFTAVLHGSTTAIWGAAFGHQRFLGKQAKGLRRNFVLYGALGAVVLHAIWNGAMFFGEITESATVLLVGLCLVPLAVAGLTGISYSAARIERPMLADALSGEVSQGLILKEHLPILNSIMQRRRKGWLPPEAQQKRYVASALRCGLLKRAIDAGIAGDQGHLRLMSERDRLLRFCPHTRQWIQLQSSEEESPEE